MQFLLLLLTIPVAWTLYFEAIEEKESHFCSYNNAVVLNEEVVLHLPEKCTSLVCRNGEIVMDMLGDMSATGCCVCFNNALVPNHFTSSGCIPVTCMNGHVIPVESVNPCCMHCQLYTSGHFVTFDHHHYDWNGLCNYTLATWPRTVEFAAGSISTQMDRTSKGCSTSFGHTTFRHDPHTIINITKDSLKDFMIDVNSETIMVPEYGVLFINSSSGINKVVAYRHNDCLVLVGSNKFGLRYCQHSMDIWVDTFLLGSVQGLCSARNYTTTTTDRDLHVENKAYYPENWRTESQTLDVCLQQESTDGCITTERHYKVPDYSNDDARERCEEILKPYLMIHKYLEPYLDSCIKDFKVYGSTVLKTYSQLVKDPMSRSQYGKECSRPTIPVTIDPEHHR